MPVVHSMMQCTQRDTGFKYTVDSSWVENSDILFCMLSATTVVLSIIIYIIAATECVAADSMQTEYTILNTTEICCICTLHRAKYVAGFTK